MDDRPHSNLMLAARITLPHFSVSSAMYLPKSRADPTSAVPLSGTSVTISDTAPTGDRYNLTICEVRQPLP